MHDTVTNTIQVTESGRVMAKVSETPEIVKEAELMYSGLTGVLSSSLTLEDVRIEDVGPGVCGYTFTLPLDTSGLSLSWTMAEDRQEAVTAVLEVLADTDTFRQEKTDRVNQMLNNLVPYFRCSDDDIVKIYYYLWSIHLMYYTGLVAVGERVGDTFCQDPERECGDCQQLRLLSTTSSGCTGSMPCSRYWLDPGSLLNITITSRTAMSCRGLTLCLTGKPRLVSVYLFDIYI